MAAYVERLAGVGRVATLGVWWCSACGNIGYAGYVAGAGVWRGWVLCQMLGCGRHGHVGRRACDMAVTGPTGRGAHTHDARLVLCCARDVAVAGPYWTSGVWPSLGRVRCLACGACSSQSK
jgi:hypothetical protein